MSRTGSTIRSAKMNATTPPKLIPPFHGTAANGMLPTEHTNEMTATIGPIIGPQSFDRTRWSTTLPEVIRHPGGERPGDEQTTDDVHPHRRPVHDEVVADRGKPFGGREALPDGSAAHRHVHLGVPLHSARNAAVRLSLGFQDHLGPQEEPE